MQRVSVLTTVPLNGMGWLGRVGVHLLTAVSFFLSPDYSIELRGEPADRAEDAQR